MRNFLLAAALLGCGTDPECVEPERLPIDEACADAARRYCCGFDDAFSHGEFSSCFLARANETCHGVGSASGCDGGGLCLRSSVDFDACNVALDAIVGAECVEPAAVYPDACISLPCAGPDEGCAEEEPRDYGLFTCPVAEKEVEG